MKRVHNFYAGPAALPLPALERAYEELFDFSGAGMSVLEISHRSKEYDAVHNEAIALLRELMGIPENYHVLFVQGGASTQFATLPMNLIPAGGSADYLITGAWSEKALKEANIVARGRAAVSTKGDNGYVRVPKSDEYEVDPQAAYLHYTSNNTIYGTQYHWVPEAAGKPLIVDMSSDILSYPMDVSKFGVIYAGAQKNLGPSGVTVVIIRKDLVDNANQNLPTMFKYATHAKKNSLYNTCPTFGIYLLRNVLSWVKDQGGVTAVEKVNTAKATTLYGAIDGSDGFYRGTADVDSRSKMNITFRLKTTELEEAFIAEAKKRDFIGCKGHRDVGGIRISTYNAVSLASVEALVEFMKEFQNSHS